MRDIGFTQVTFPLETLINNIASGQIGLPDIQRPFVWSNVKVRDLFDSMYKGYPVGYLLFWQNGLIPDHKTIGSDPKQLSPSLVIVDGQQRLTSLYAVIKGSPVVRSNYRSEHIRIGFNPIEEVFEVTSAAIERDRSFIPGISRLWSEESDLFQVVADYINGLRSVREVSNDEVKRIQTSIVKLQGLLKFPFTALQLAADITEEAVADIFVRINSQGKTLNQADFILTLMSVFWDKGRMILECFCRESRTPSTGKPSPFNYFIEPSPDQLLRVGVGIAFKRARLGHVYSILRGKDLETGEFSEVRRIDQFERLQDAQSKVLDLQNWHDFMHCLQHAGYRTGLMISSKNALLNTYTLYLIGKTEFALPEHNLRLIIAQWFFMSALTGRYTGSTETRMESDLALLRDVSTAEDFTGRLSQTCNVSLTSDFWEVTLPNELATSAARSPSLFAFEAAQVLLGAPVLFSKLKIAEVLDPALKGGHKSIEKHHLFPKGHLAELGFTERRDINQIANYAYVEWVDNVKISKWPPVEYLPPLKERFSSAELTHMYYLHGLPEDWEHMGYRTFLEHRRERMANIIHEGYEQLISGPQFVEKPDEIDLVGLFERGESDEVEFKSTLRVNLHTGQRDSRMELAVLRTMAGFLNTHGGRLIIGVSDDGTPLGLDVDAFVSEDKMSLHLSNIVNKRMSPNAWIAMHANFDDYENVRVLAVNCKKSRTPVYVKHENEERFYVRTGPATTELSVSQAAEYIKHRFG